MSESEAGSTRGGSKIMDPDAYFQTMTPRDTPYGLWRWEDIEAVLDEMSTRPKRYPAYRRFAALVNDAWEGAPGASPLIFVGVQRIHPGETVPGHRHNSVAIYYWIKGTGRAIIEGEEVPFKAGDFFTCPAWNAHGFVNDGDEDMVMIAIHDLPLLAQARALFWEEPLGADNVQHVVRERASSWSAAEGPADLEGAPRLVRQSSPDGRAR